MESLNFYIQVFGCQMNDLDSEALAHSLERHGHLQVAEPSDADVILLNTCTVREKAEQKVYSLLGRYKFLKDEKPSLILGVGGCMAQAQGRKILSRAPYVDIVFGTKAIHKVPDMIKKVLETGRRSVAVLMPEGQKNMEELFAERKAEGFKAFVTIMQGCDNHCAYCIVPAVRGPELSRPPEDVFSEVEHLVSQGVKEVTLLGQNVNSYGVKEGSEVNFPSLVSKIASIDGLERIRFTTSHPKDLSDELIQAFVDEPKLMPHIHLPLQSGSDRILKAMRRKYTAGGYLELVERLRRTKPGIALTSDMIVGFPGETEYDFKSTLSMMAEVVFDGLFSFKYSTRPGTPAEKLPEQVPEREKEERLNRLQALQREHSRKRNDQCVGKTFKVMIDGVSKAGQGQLAGRTPENKTVNFHGPESLIGGFADVAVTEARTNSLVGERRRT